MKPRTVKKSSQLWSKHFLPSDYKDQSTDSNSGRKRKKCIEELQRKRLKPDAIPSIWPGLEHHAPKEVAPRSKNMSLPSCRRADIVTEEETRKDEIADLEKLKSSKIILPAGVMKVIGDSSVSFVKLSTDELTRVDYAVNVHPSLSADQQSCRQNRRPWQGWPENKVPVRAAKTLEKEAICKKIFARGSCHGMYVAKHLTRSLQANSTGRGVDTARGLEKKISPSVRHNLS